MDALLIELYLLLLVPLRIFAFNPPAIFLAASVFFVPALLRSYRASARIALACISSIWLSFGLYETHFVSLSLPVEQQAMRVDLALYGPIIVLSGAAGLLLIIFGRKPLRKVDAPTDRAP